MIAAPAGIAITAAGIAVTAAGMWIMLVRQTFMAALWGAVLTIVAVITIVRVARIWPALWHVIW